MSFPISQITGQFTPGEIDPLMEAIRQSIIDAGEPGDPLAEFGEAQVVIVPPEETDAGLDGKMKTAMGRSSGVCLLLIAGSGKNPDVDAPGPVINISLEAQIYVSTRIRGPQGAPVLRLVMAVARLLHLAKVRIDEFETYEVIKFISYDPLADPDFTAYALNFEREISL